MKLPIKTVEVTDHEQAGRIARMSRLMSGKTLRETAEKLGISAAFLSDLELGRRHWTQARLNAYAEAIR